MSGASRPRWWLGLLIFAAIGGVLTWIWVIQDSEHRQGQVIRTQMTLTVGSILFGVWWLVLSALAWRTRIIGVVVVGALVGAFFGTFRYAGVDGDLVPVFRYRWSSVETTWTGVALTGVAQDYPGFLGTQRDGVVTGVELARDWEASPPQLVWRRPMGTGWSGFAVAGDRAVTQEQHGDEERVVCYELASGKLLWSIADPVRYVSNLAGDGPRATPTIAEGRVYTLGGTGVVNAIDLATGARLWTRDVARESQSDGLTWGMSGSPLVHEGRVIVGTGATEGLALTALDANTGLPVWGAGDDIAGYAAPFVATLAGVTQIIAFNGASVSGHDVGTGRVLWAHPWSSRQPNIAQPLPVGGDRLLVSSGYRVGSRLLRLKPGTDGGLDAETVWRSARLKSKFASMILHQGSVYGLDDGILTCLDVETGGRRWKAGRYGHGQIIRVGDVLFVMTEMGDIVLVALDAAEHRELTRFNVIEGKVWNPPALAGSRLLVRNNREAALFLLPVQ
ncbi:MAG: hypothetical protein CMJ83_01715 [Planctomycetes bacterium]|nr:hypothetical protein [Planctomycetota bacterium]